MEQYLLFLFPFAFAGLWCAISWLISRFGWHQLSQRYGTICQAPAEMHNFCYGRMNYFCNYNGVLRIGFLQDGIYLSIFPLFKIGHPPLLIPYRDIHIGDSLLVFYRELHIGNPKIATLALSKEMVRKIEAHMAMLA